jgi:hypothetical protein
MLSNLLKTVYPRERLLPLALFVVDIKIKRIRGNK